MEQNEFEEGPENTLAFMTQFGWDFPVVRDMDPHSPIFGAYGISRDNWVIVDAAGNIAYKSGDGYTGAEFSTFREEMLEVLTNLGIVPVRPTTWGSIKAFYR